MAYDSSQTRSSFPAGAGNGWASQARFWKSIASSRRGRGCSSGSLFLSSFVAGRVSSTPAEDHYLFHDDGFPLPLPLPPRCTTTTSTHASSLLPALGNFEFSVHPHTLLPRLSRNLNVCSLHRLSIYPLMSFLPNLSPILTLARFPLLSPPAFYPSHPSMSLIVYSPTHHPPFPPPHPFSVIYVYDITATPTPLLMTPRVGNDMNKMLFATS